MKEAQNPQTLLVEEVAKTKSLSADRIESALKSFENADREVFYAIIDVFEKRENKAETQKSVIDYYSKQVDNLQRKLDIIRNLLDLKA